LHYASSFRKYNNIASSVDISYIDDSESTVHVPFSLYFLGEQKEGQTGAKASSA
jgi:hypothetical protein